MENNQIGEALFQETERFRRSDNLSAASRIVTYDNLLVAANQFLDGDKWDCPYYEDPEFLYQGSGSQFWENFTRVTGRSIDDDNLLEQCSCTC